MMLIIFICITIIGSALAIAIPTVTYNKELNTMQRLFLHDKYYFNQDHEWQEDYDNALKDLNNDKEV